MRNLNSRVDKLETSTGVGLDRHTASVWEVFDPAPEGPVSGGICHISVFDSDQDFSRDNFENETDLIAAADAEHRRIHGKPLPYFERTTA